MSKAIRFVGLWIGMIATIAATGFFILGSIYALMSAIVYLYSFLSRYMTADQFIGGACIVLMVSTCGVAAHAYVYGRDDE